MKTLGAIYGPNLGLSLSIMVLTSETNTRNYLFSLKILSSSNQVLVIYQNYISGGFLGRLNN